MNRVCANGKSVRLAEFAEFLNDVQRRAIQSRIPFEETKLPGKKENLLKLLESLYLAYVKLVMGRSKAICTSSDIAFPLLA